MSGVVTRPATARAAGAVGAVLIVACAAAALIGWSPWPIVVAALLPWFLVVRERRGGPIAMASCALGGLWLVLATTILTGVARLSPVPVLVGVGALAAVAGLVVLIRSPRIARPGRGLLTLGIPAVVGSIVWGAVLLIARVVPGGGPIGWVMQGDSANNVLFARLAIYRGGLEVGAGANPVPLASSLMASVMAVGRDRLGPAQLTGHDLDAFAQLWAVTIAGSCLLAGILAGSIAAKAGRTRPVTATAAAGGSLLPLTWFFSGYSIEFGFFNTQVVFPVLVAAVILALEGRSRPTAGIVAQLIAATLVLAVWSPLVLVPVALGLLFLRDWRTLLGDRRASLPPIAIALAQLLLYAALLVVPSLLASGAALSATGGAYPFPKYLLPGIGLVTIAVVAAAMLRRDRRAMVDLMAVCVTTVGGLLLLLLASGSLLGPWTYYPTKYAWIGSTLLIVILVGALAGAVARWVRPPGVRVTALLGIAATTVLVLAWFPSAVPGYDARTPVTKIVSGSLSDHDRLPELVARYARLDRANLLWRTGRSVEGATDFWIMQLYADSLDRNFELRRLAYYLDSDSPADLCSAAELMGGRLHVYTPPERVDAIRRQVERRCPDVVDSVSALP